MTFASLGKPIRASSLPMFCACPGNQRMDGGNQWAQTGTLTHVAIEAYHKLGSEDAALFCMQSKKEANPLGDSNRAAAYFRLYLSKQASWGKVVLTERKVRCTLPPHESDPTQEEVVIDGTMDQLRETDYGPTVCDVKTGAPVGWEMVNWHATQLSAYMLGAHETLGVDVKQGAILRMQDFRTGGPIFYPCGWGLDGARAILEPVRLFVAQVRAGKALRMGGKHCDWCDFKTIGNCVVGKRPERKMIQLKTLDDLL